MSMTKNRLAVSAAVVAVVAAMSASAAAYEIKMPEKSDGSQILAARELVHHLELKASEVPYRFVFAKPDGAPEAQPFESRYLVKGDTVWFWGDDDGPDEGWDWGDNRGKESQKHNGSLFAVELFAEKELGMHFIWAGEDGIAVKKVKRLELKDGAEGRHVNTLVKARIRSYPSYHRIPWDEIKGVMPAALYGSRAPSTHEERILWQKRNRLQDREFFQYGHAFTKWKDRFMKTHPEYLNLHVDPQTGKTERGWTGSEKSDRTKLCVSNEAVVDQIIADWVEAGKPRFLNVCENDSARWCECENCRKLDCPKPGEQDLEMLTDRYVNLWNRIAKKVIALRPDVMLTTYLYSAYRYPPRRERLEHGDNMLCGFVCGETEDAMAMIKAWSSAGMKHFFFRPNYLHTITCIHRGLERFFYDQFHEMLDYGMIGTDFDANDNRPPTALEFYVVARMFADPEAKFEDIVDDYCTGYGAAADEVKAYYAAVRKTGEAVRNARQKAKVSGVECDFIKKSDKLPHSMDGGRSETELLAKKAMLSTAVARHAAARDLSDVEMRRLKALELQAEHGILTYRFLSSVESQPIAEVKERAEALKAFRVAHCDDMPDIYASIFRLWWAEIRYWQCYAKRLARERK